MEWIGKSIAILGICAMNVLIAMSGPVASFLILSLPCSVGMVDMIVSVGSNERIKKSTKSN